MEKSQVSRVPGLPPNILGSALDFSVDQERLSEIIGLSRDLYRFWCWWVSKNVLCDLLVEEGVCRLEGFSGWCALGSQGL